MKVKASHILLMDADAPRSTATRTRAEARTAIAELADRLAKGEDFASLAREFSDCPSGQNGGDLGHFGRGMMVREFEESAFALSVGQVSAPVETTFGLHLILRTE